MARDMPFDRPFQKFLCRSERVHQSDAGTLGESRELPGFATAVASFRMLIGPKVTNLG